MNKRILKRWAREHRPKEKYMKVRGGFNASLERIQRKGSHAV